MKKMPASRNSRENFGNRPGALWNNVVTRRRFLKSTGTAGIAIAISSDLIPVAQADPPGSGFMEVIEYIEIYIPYPSAIDNGDGVGSSAAGAAEAALTDLYDNLDAQFPGPPYARATTHTEYMDVPDDATLDAVECTTNGVSPPFPSPHPNGTWTAQVLVPENPSGGLTIRFTYDWNYVI